VTGYFDYRREPYKGVAASYPSGFDFIIDAIGKRGQINAALAVAAENATVGIYGIDDRNENSIAVSAVRKTFTFYAGGYVASEVHGEVVRRMRDGSLDASLWIDVSRPYPLERIGKAFAAVERRECVKALIACNQ
jgi:threonine dehydrogenase-like Zn-dependent dehydrogenase